MPAFEASLKCTSTVWSAMRLFASVPTVHVFDEALARCVPVESKTFVEGEQLEASNLLGQVRPETAKELGRSLEIVDHHSALVTVQRIVGSQRRRGPFDHLDDVRALGRLVNIGHG